MTENQESVIPAKAGIQCFYDQPETGFRLSPE